MLVTCNDTIVPFLVCHYRGYPCLRMCTSEPVMLPLLAEVRELPPRRLPLGTRQHNGYLDSLQCNY